MTLPTGQIAISDINAELGLSPSYSSSLSFLTGYMKTPPANPNMGAFQGLAYYQRNMDGNCNNGNCTAQGAPNGNCTNPNAPNGNCTNQGGPNGNCSNNCNCGNIGDGNCFITGPWNCSNCQVCTPINCSNCQVCTPINCSVCSNCSTINCSNCDGQNYLQNNCNCACTYNCTQSAVSYNCSTSAVGYNCSTSAVSYNCSVCSGGSHNCNCACDCSKIVCAKLYDFGLMDQNIWAADQAYGRWLREHDRSVYRGYIRWARIVTAWMDGRGPDFMYWVNKEDRSKRQQELMTRVAYNIGTPWSQHMAYLMGALPEDNLQGRILMKIGTTISRVVDRIPREPKSKIKHGLLTVATMWACLYSSYYASVVLTQAITYFKRKANTNLVQEISK